MENTTQYHLAYSIWHWEEWHEKVCEDGYDTIEEVELNMDKGLIKSDNICDIKIVKVTTNYETVKVIK